jgi:CHASE2 domain-containing sensor protein/CheY-like chemotaxis protein
VAGLVIAVELTGFFQLLEWATYDRFFRWRPPEPVDERLLIVTIDESDIEKVGYWPLPDAHLARAVATLNQYQPVAIGLDMYRNLPVEPGHQAWVEMMESTPNLIGVEKASGRRVPPPETLSQLNRVALTDLVIDADGKVRRALLSNKGADGQVKYGIGAQLALMYLEEQGVTFQPIDATKKHYRLGRAVFRPFTGNDGGYVRTNSGGYQILLNYRGQLDRFPTVPLRAVLENRLDPALVRDRVVLIGTTAPSLNDEFFTPYSSRLVETPELTPGVGIHANTVSHILSAALDGRETIRTWANPWDWVWILVWSGVGTALHWGWLESDRNQSRILTRCLTLGGYVVLGGGILIAGNYLAFLAGWWLPTISPLVALIGSAGAIAGSQILRLQQQRSELARQKLAIEREKFQAEAASQAKSQFLAKMSHELRTPLNAILGFSQVMNRDATLSPQQQEYLNIIQRSGEHLLALINDILEMSKIEAGRSTFKASRFDLYRLLDTLAAMFHLTASSKGLKLIVERSPEVPQYVQTDEGKLRQVLINLLGNAVKFTQVGSITLRVSREDESVSPSPWLHFEVSDTGAGIAPEDIDSLFDAFTQTQTGERTLEGTGLGLSISRQFVELMGGELTANSKLGQGATFAFTIPVQPARASDVQTSDGCTGRAVGLAPEQPEYRILVAEDDWASRQLLVQLLSSLGFQVREAKDGKEAIALWSSWQPHLIFMDMRMPVMDGYEATKQIKAQIKGQSTAIIALTASAFTEERAAILSEGCDDFISKPFRERILLEKITQHLGVRYCYEDSPKLTTAEPRARVEPLTSEALTVMPPEWLAQLHRAAESCQDEEILVLAEQIPEPYGALKLALVNLVENFRLDLILDLTQAITASTHE